jgi:hypothetical protein
VAEAAVEAVLAGKGLLVLQVEVNARNMETAHATLFPLPAEELVIAINSL